MPVFYLVLDKENPGFDANFESSRFSKAMKDIAAVTEELKIQSAFELFSYTPQNSLCPPGYEETEIPWFEPDVGITWLGAVTEFIRNKSDLAGKYDTLLLEFGNCERILREAKRIGAKWQFEMDV